MKMKLKLPIVPEPHRSRLAKARVPVAGLMVVAAGCLAVFPPKSGHAYASDRDLEAKVQSAFPNTHIGSVKCVVAPGICEVTAGKTVFYTTPDGRYAMVGALLDLKDRVDLTDRRVKELAALEKITGTIGDPSPSQLAEAQPSAAAPGGPPPSSPSLGVIKLDLPVANAIVHHPGAPLKVSVISDLNCGFCKRLFEELKAAPDIQVTEYPVQLLSPDSLDKAKLALCSHDREAASDSLYFGGEVKATGDCKSALDAVEANTAFARAHGVSGTPTIIRADGQAHAGWMSLEELRPWLKGAHA